MTTLDDLRRTATLLKRAYGAGNSAAAARVRQYIPDGPDPLKHADFLHVVARENSFESWPRLKAAVETQGMDRAAKQQRLKIAVFQGQTFVIQQLLKDTPDLAQGLLGLEIALYDLKAVRAALSDDPARATQMIGPRRPMLHLAFSRYHRVRPDLTDDMLAIADLLLTHGADPNDAFDQNGEPLSALYGAIGHGDNMPLAQWLLDHGANPNDGESLYHATELGHHEGLRLLIAHGVSTAGTNAVPRALDFNDHGAVELLLRAGADPNEGLHAKTGQIPALHQAARRMCDGAMITLLLQAGADPSAPWRECTPYGLARVMGNTDAADLIAKAGGDTTLTPIETLLARAADGQDSPGQFVDPALLHDEYRNLVAVLLNTPARLGHIKRLVALGMEYDRPSGMGVPPVQLAGWGGLAKLMAYFLSLKPDLTHRNNFGGTLLGTIIHGSENAGRGDDIDHIACVRLALEHGLSLPRSAIDLAGDPDMRDFLAEWAAQHPGHVIDGASA